MARIVCVALNVLPAPQAGFFESQERLDSLTQLRIPNNLARA